MNHGQQLNHDLIRFDTLRNQVLHSLRQDFSASGIEYYFAQYFLPKTTSPTSTNFIEYISAFEFPEQDLMKTLSQDVQAKINEMARLQADLLEWGKKMNKCVTAARAIYETLVEQSTNSIAIKSLVDAKPHLTVNTIRMPRVFSHGEWDLVKKHKSLIVNKWAYDIFCDTAGQFDTAVVVPRPGIGDSGQRFEWWFWLD